jgi:Putative lumazine-binding
MHRNMLNKRLLPAIFLLAVLHGSIRALDQPSDESLVRETIQHYLHGLKFNDVESLKKAFYPDSKLFFVKKNGSLGQLTQTDWYEGFKANAGKEEEGDLQIASVDVTGTIASVKVEEDYPGSHYTDYVSLLKLDGEWRIVNKVFYARSKTK